MFSVIFEVCPKPGQWDAYLAYGRLLRPDLAQVDGFIDNVRYASKRRPGWVLSLSTWRDEKALVRWRTAARHHDVQEKGRFEVFADYHLRVGQVTADNQVPDGHALREQRLDETEAGASKAVSIIEMRQPPGLAAGASAEAAAAWLGLPAGAPLGLVEWDLFEAVLEPGEMALLLSWRGAPEADAGETAAIPPAARLRRVRVVRDYGMFERHEAPQYYAEAHRAAAPRS